MTENSPHITLTTNTHITINPNPIIFTGDGRVMGAIFGKREHHKVQVPYMRG
jgi:hypothetical protein